MIFLRRYYRWRYFRRNRLQSYRFSRGRGNRIGLSFGRHLAKSTREGRRSGGFSDRENRRKKRFLITCVAVPGLLFIVWFVTESIYALSLF